MDAPAPRIIRIAAALIEDGRGRLLLVRKMGSRYFMQAGGKIEPGEDALTALTRELHEEIGLRLCDAAVRPFGRFAAPAANEPGHRVEADIFHLRIDQKPVAAAEIAEAIWIDPAEADAMPLAPLTRDHILPAWRRASMEGGRG